MAEDLKVAIAGFGYWGPNIARVIAEMDHIGVSLCAVSDPAQEARARFAERYVRIPVFSDLHSLMQAVEVDAVIVATPTSTHYELAAAVLEAGKHVLVEKPVALETSEAQRLDRLAKDRGLTLMVGLTYQYNACVSDMRELVRRGELGKVLYMRSVRVNLGPVRRDTNVIWDLAPHDISILMTTIGESPWAVRATGSRHLGGRNEDVGHLTLYFQECTAYVSLSWIDPVKVRETTIVGTKKMLVYNDLSPNQKLQVFDKAVDRVKAHDSFGEFPFSYRYGEITKPFVEEHEPLRAQCEHFVDCIRGGKTPRSGGELGTEITRILSAAADSLIDDSQLVRIIRD